MIKLEKDTKTIKNVKLKNIEKYKIIATNSAIIAATILSAPYINFKKINVTELEHGVPIAGRTVAETHSYSYEEYIIDKYRDKIVNYAQIYNLNEEFVFDVAINNIKNYQTIYVTENNYDNIDMYIILLCKDITKNPEKYTDNPSSIVGNNNYQSDLKVREMVYKYADLFGVDRTFALTIACGESGYFTKPIATDKNNPYSLVGSKGFNTYDNLERGILEGVLNLKLNYIDENLTTYKALNNIYCQDGSDWESLMIGVQRNIEDGYVLYDEENKVKTYNIGG